MLLVLYYTVLYCTHTVLRLYSCYTHTVLILYSYYTHTVLILYSHPVPIHTAPAPSKVASVFFRSSFVSTPASSAHSCSGRTQVLIHCSHTLCILSTLLLWPNPGTDTL
jgi:hypothetical protein